MSALAAIGGLVLLAAFVFGLAWILKDLAPHELRDWSTESIEEAETTEGERP